MNFRAFLRIIFCALPSSLIAQQNSNFQVISETVQQHGERKPTITNHSSGEVVEIWSNLNSNHLTHDHYAEEKQSLVKNYKIRQKQAAKEKRELAQNPPKPADMNITFWNNDSNL